MTQSLSIIRLLTDKAALNKTRIDQVAIAPLLDEDEVILKIERAAITTNNITYAAFGDAMQYWDFFPTGDDDWGHMPVWGFARVAESKADGIERGELFYGYFPLASHIRMQAERVTERGFYDGSAHRRTLVSAYNQYTRCSHDEAYRAGGENYQALVRPLFITSFMCADFLADNGFFGAKQVVVASASSKTAYGTAHCLHGKSDVRLIALTSSRNRDFVAGLGCYDEVMRYEEVGQIDAAPPTLYLDFSGDGALRAAVHHHFNASLVYDCFAGSAQNTQFLQKTALPGPEPRLYFAPIQIRKRNIDWGHEEVNRRFNAAQASFIERISRPG
ncbi:MAG TPA: DUF2855 family protein, partial [Burkholderiaceae bacterium]